MKYGKYIYVAIGLIAVITASFLGISFAQNNPTNGTKNSVRLSRSQNLSAQWQGKITVRVSGMGENDWLNIRTSSELKINTKILSIGEQDLAVGDGRTMKVPGDGQAISENALMMSESEVNFSRPQNNDRIYVDVEIPKDAEVEIFFNQEKVHNSSVIYAPIAVKNGVAESGDNDLAKAQVRLISPQTIGQRPDGIVQISGNRLYVPFSKLQLKKSSALQGTASIKAVIEINEQGLVEDASVFGENSEAIKQQILGWEFIPYLKDGTAVKVQTLYTRE
jgi:hypothetical protein